jgi:dTDP-4-amino-4,6-dideoxygalactose transaminase
MIPVFKPIVDEDTKRAAIAALGGALGMGELVRLFEEDLADALELPTDRRVVAVNTGTSALHLALLAAGVGPGDEVITPALNNIGDFQAIGACGARPVFCDVLFDDFGVDVVSAERMIGPAVKAILPLHYAGVPCDAGGVYDLAFEYGLRVVEDACHAIGSRYKGVPIGANGDFACYSFDPIKTITSIDGGAVACRAEDAGEMYDARLLGVAHRGNEYVPVGTSLARSTNGGRYDVHSQGFRYHLSNLHAAIGISQLERLDEWTRNRRVYARAYTDALDELDGITTPHSTFDDVSLFAYVIRVHEGLRDELRRSLATAGVDSGVHWRPGHWLSRYRTCRQDALPVSERLGEEIVTLPLWSIMDDGAQEQVVEAIARFFA